MMSLELGLSIYASIIATLVLVWRIYAYYNDRKSRLRISQRVMNRIMVYAMGIDEDSQSKHLEIKVTNIGTSPRYIERPLFRINKKIEGADTYSAWTREELETRYPRLIEPGQRIEISIPLEGIKEKLAEAKGATKVKSIILDTHGKQFSTKWLVIN